MKRLKQIPERSEPMAPRSKGQGSLEVHPEPRSLSRLKGWDFLAVQRVRSPPLDNQRGDYYLSIKKQVGERRTML